jgi:hypothetical protein
MPKSLQIAEQRMQQHLDITNLVSSLTKVDILFKLLLSEEQAKALLCFEDFAIDEGIKPEEVEPVSAQ